MSQVFIECDPLGPVLLTGLDGKKFYRGILTHNVEVNIGDNVRVTLEEGDVGYGQVLAIYDEADEEDGEGVMVEVRWFSTPDELDNKKRKVLGEALENELIETDAVDDISAGAIVEVISVVGASSAAGSSDKKNKRAKTMDDSAPQFVCRYFDIAGSHSLQNVQLRNMLSRGMRYSEYQHAYVEYLASSNLIDSSVVGGDMEMDMYSDAIRRLHISVLPEKLPCRQIERDKVYNDLKNAIIGRQSTKPMFISGMPGTGKTATAHATVNELLKEAEKGDLPVFDFIEINCLKLQSPQEAYTVAWRGITDQVVPPKSANQKLSQLFETAALNSHQTAQRLVTICLIDELDFLVTRDEEVLFNFFTWPIMKDSLFVVIGISNQMDLPERLTTRVASRVQMDRLRFNPYSHDQIKEILEERLKELGPSIFEKGALSFVARKAATVAGDLRAALKICQRAIEMARDQKQRIDKYNATKEASSKADTPSFDIYRVNQQQPQLAEPECKSIMNLINVATAEYRQSPMMATVSRACTLDKALLVAACKHFRLTGETEISLDVLWGRLEDLLYAMRNTPSFTLLAPPQFVFDKAINRLVEQGLMKRTGAKPINCSGNARQGMFSFRLEVNDIVSALQDDSTGLLKFL